MNEQVRRIDTSKKRKCSCLTSTVSNIIGRLGVIVSRYPLYFVIVPVIISCLLSIGLIRIQTNNDNDSLLTADRGKYYDAKQFMDKTFHTNSGTYDILRLTNRPHFPMIHIVNDREGNILRKEFLDEIQIVDQVVKNTTAFVDGKIIVYSDVCQIVDGKCSENTLIEMLTDSENAIYEILRMKYPVNMDSVTYAYKILSVNLGGVTIDDNGYIIEAKAVRLFYILDEWNANKKKWNEEWTKAVYNKLRDYSFEHIKTFPDPFSSTDFQVERISQKLVSLVSVAVVVVAIFCVSTNMTNNWVKSKPWLGVANVVSAGLAVATTFGLLSACGVENLLWNVSLPFIILGTEVDDSFVVLACWKATDCNDSVEKRMEQTYRNAAVSITITSLTNFISYCIAMTSPFPAIRIFSLYAATCIFFSYFYQLFFFGGCLALSGYREEKGLHPFTFKLAFETIGQSDYHNEQNEDCFMKFFRDTFSAFIFHSVLREGFNVYKFNSETSEITQGFHVYYKYFTKYPFTVHVVINETLDYSNPRVQESVNDFLKKFHTIENIAGYEFEFSWLKYYNKFQTHPFSKYSLKGYDLSQKQDFMDALRNVFLKFTGAKQFNNDIIYNHNYTDIVASRFLFLAKDVSDRVTEFKIVNDLSKIAEQAPFSVVIHTIISHLVEQGMVIRQITFQLFWITSLLIFGIFVSLIPNLHCAVIVAICVGSIIAQTIGFMSLWAINLDIVSLMCLILCIGFCVNYPTHICYCFITSSQATTEEKLKDSLRHLTGDLLIVIAQIITATQMVIEEKFVSKNNVPPLQAVGWEGFFGFIILSILLVPMYYIPVGKNFFHNPKGNLEDAIDGFYQIANSWQVCLGVCGTVISIAFFNFAGISVTKEISATTRMVLDSIRTLVVWICGMLLFHEKFGWLQLVGFLILLVGMCLYNDIYIRQFWNKLTRRGTSEELDPLLNTENGSINAEK
ncbi:patched domain-containing protein 3-like [Centruroides sculpturatus]|uniref:patched domain-containing protein 3-like n=1 Tax=Centruroides sculpturatus TaxID=218467 RepID=UPI000C6E9055|nr:patched domain-containing protein 3-like [Centruroides sculpturatus]